MSIRVDTASLIAGSVVVGVPGLGVLGSLIPATGEHGPGYAYDDLIAGDETKEIRGLITTWPSNGTLTAFEDTSFEYDGTSDTFAYQLYVDGVVRGSVVTHTITIGAGVSGALTIAIPDATASLTGSTGSAGVSGTITASIPDATASLAGQIAVRGTITAQVEDATVTLVGSTGSTGVMGAITAQIDDCTASLSGLITVRGVISAQITDCTMSLTAAGTMPVLAPRRGPYRNAQTATRPANIQ